jgi:peptidoglycan/LPS O-acetylase OafA/YrhL
MKSPSLRFHEIDFLRGVACISVLAFHFLSRGPKTHTMPGIDSPLIEATAAYGYLGVHLFFVISGFVILMSANGATARNFVASRASRLYPGLWAAATLTAGTAWLLDDARFAVSAVDYLANLTMVPHWFDMPYVDGAYWSLGYELHFYILVWLAIGLRLMGRLEWLLAGWLLVSAVNALRPMWPVEFWVDAKWAPFFTAGGVFYLVRTHGVTPFRLVLLGASFALAQVYAVWYGTLPDLAGGQAIVPAVLTASIVTAIFALFWLIATARFRMKASRFIYYAGVLTYPMYVIHQNFGFMVYGRIQKASGMAIGSLVVMLVLLLLISWCIHAYVERPLSQMMRRRLGNASSSHAPANEPTLADNAPGCGKRPVQPDGFSRL